MSCCALYHQGLWNKPIKFQIYIHRKLQTYVDSRRYHSAAVNKLLVVKNRIRRGEFLNSESFVMKGDFKCQMYQEY